MSLRFKIVVLVLVVLTAAGVVWFRNVQTETRKHSPVQTATLATPGIEVMYCSPGVKDRAIFGGLVPYNEVWRTGANQPTTFDTQVALQIGENTLEPGIYTLWTIPGEETWQVIWNSSMYPWGVSWGGKPSATYVGRPTALPAISPATIDPRTTADQQAAVKKASAIQAQPAHENVDSETISVSTCGFLGSETISMPPCPCARTPARRCPSAPPPQNKVGKRDS